LEADIDSIWSEIYKPEDFQDVKSKDYFDFAFQFLPHKIFQAEQFMKSCLSLKSRFLDHESNDNLFKGRGDPKVRIPIDGLALFIDKTWEKIRS
jgi:hypothetical protein